MVVAVLALLTGHGLSAPAIVCPADAGNTHALAAAETQRYIYQRCDTLLPIARQLPAEGDTIALRIDDYIQVFGQLAKLRMNFLGLHSYPENPEPRSQYDSEPTVWIGPPGDFDGQGRVSRSFSASYFNTLRDGQWGYIPRPTGEYRFGASLLFERDDWGPDVMLGQCPVPTTPEGCNAVFNRTGQMFDEAFSVARMLGVKTCIGTESPLTIPGAVKERLLAQHKDPSDPAVVRELYAGIFKRIAAAHPLDYYWVWTPERWLWSGNSEKETKAFVEDFEQAAQAIKDAGDPFELATCGWVLGPKQDRAGWTRTLPRQVGVSALNEAYTGPVDPAFARISGRDKWAIPWLEEDNAILGPQLWVSRIRKDAADALAYGCTGLMGLHWRTREVGPQIAALAQAGWSQDHWNPQAGGNPPGVPQTMYYEGPKPPYGNEEKDCGSADRRNGGRSPVSKLSAKPLRLPVESARRAISRDAGLHRAAAQAGRPARL